MCQAIKCCMPPVLLIILKAFKKRVLTLVCLKRIRNYLESHQIRKLQIGSGENILEGWFNTDIYTNKKVSFLDATEQFPFDDGIFDYIFTEHLIEHLEYRKGIQMLRECLRVLKPRGKIRIATPDLRYLIELYNPEKTEVQKHEITRIVNAYFSDIGIYQDTFIINNFFRNWGHKFIYDYKVLQETMNRIGFINITHYKVGESEDKNLRGIESHGQAIPDEINKLQTFVVEGTKPS